MAASLGCTHQCGSVDARYTPENLAQHHTVEERVTVQSRILEEPAVCSVRLLAHFSHEGVVETGGVAKRGKAARDELKLLLDVLKFGEATGGV